MLLPRQLLLTVRGSAELAVPQEETTSPLGHLCCMVSPIRVSTSACDITHFCSQIFVCSVYCAIERLLHIHHCTPRLNHCRVHSGRVLHVHFCCKCGWFRVGNPFVLSIRFGCFVAAFILVDVSSGRSYGADCVFWRLLHWFIVCNHDHRNTSFCPHRHVLPYAGSSHYLLPFLSAISIFSPVPVSIHASEL